MPRVDVLGCDQLDARVYSPGNRYPERSLPQREGRITCSQAHTLVPLVLAPGSEPFHVAWIERAAEVTVRRLGEDVEQALATNALDPLLLPEPSEAGLCEREPSTTPSISPRVCRSMRSTGAKRPNVWVANVPADVARLFRACLCSVARRLNTSPGMAMLDHAIASRWVPTPRAYRVSARDGWRCTVPGCTSQRSLHAHHVLFRSAGGSDDDPNLITLCAAHHQRCVHGGVVRISGHAPGALVFEMPLGRFRSGDRVVRP